MTTIPHDIWLHVAQFLPALFLRDLLSVNHSFFDIAMDCRYRQLIFAYLDNRMVRNLVRLKDPMVAKRVRILHIYPGFLKDTERSDLFEPEKSDLIDKRSFRTRLADIANHLLEQKIFPRHPKYRMMQSLRKSEDVVQVMSEILGSLPNVTDYYVTWSGLSTVGTSAAPFLTTVFRPSLRKLSLNLSLANVHSLLPHDFAVSNLEELHLCIHSELVQSEKENSDILRYHLAPAISRLQSTLKTLVISSWEPSDLSPLFHSIDHIAALDDLCISIPVESWHLGSPAGVNGFLRRHQLSLRCLRLRATQFGGNGFTPDYASLNGWITDVINGVRLTKLRVLDITSNLFPIDTSLICLKWFSRTITSLSLTGIYRSYDDVDKAISLLSCSTRDETLGKLRIGPVSLSPQLIDLFAMKLPQLYRLELLVKDIIPLATEVLPVYGTGQILIQRTLLMDEFFDKMETRRYPYWQLRHMLVLADTLPDRSYYEALLERTFHQCVPSLQVFT